MYLLQFEKKLSRNSMFNLTVIIEKMGRIPFIL